MRDTILSELKQIEKDENIKILFAVEAGSRAWGISSEYSDYDVRFVYIHSVEWYLSIQQQRDVLVYPINTNLDIYGWDIKKALGLFNKSNPSLMEWINSPIVYLNKNGLLESLIELSPSYFNPKTNINHYLNMAKDNYKAYLQREEVKVKEYFYALRPILVCKWLEKNNTIPTMNFQTLLETQIKDYELMSAIRKLLARKMSGEKLDMGHRIDIISNFIDNQIRYYKEYAAKLDGKGQNDITALDALFKETLKIAWE